MVTLFLIVIYAAFISLGLPDSLLGVAWPVAQKEFGASLGDAGIISMVISVGTVISSLFSSKLLKRFGVGKVTVVSVLMTALALLGFSFVPAFVFMILLAIPLGLGAGAVDSGLNEYVAEHYESRHMSWLHCFWGVGAMAGPLIMSQYMSLGVDWRMGYLTVAIIQFVLVAVLIATLPLWDKVAKKTSPKKQEADANGENPGEPEREADLDPPIASGQGGFLAPLKIKGAKIALISFFLYCGVEITLGLWGSSFLITEKGIDAATAAQWVSLYWGGLTVGRLVSGFLAIRFNNQQMIRIGEFTVLLGVVCLLLPSPQFVCLIGFILVGAGCAPIYPCMLHETPVRFGKEDAQSMMGFQMAVCYTGSTLLPPFFGLVATKVNVGLLPVFLLVYIVIMLVSSEASNRIFQSRAAKLNQAKLSKRI